MIAYFAQTYISRENAVVKSLQNINRISKWSPLVLLIKDGWLQSIIPLIDFLFGSLLPASFSGEVKISIKAQPPPLKIRIGMCKIRHVLCAKYGIYYFILIKAIVRHNLIEMGYKVKRYLNAWSSNE